MRVVYYAVPWFMDVEAPFIAAMSRLVDLHVLLEINPLAWRTSMFDLPAMSLPTGIVPADRVLAALPDPVRHSWSEVKDFRLAVYGGQRAYHPANWRVGASVLSHIGRVKPDVVHLEGYSGRLSWVVPALGRRPLLLSVHDPRPHVGEGGWRKAMVRRVSFASARRLILHNRSQMAAFCRDHGLSPDKVEAIPLGVCDAFTAWGGDGQADGLSEDGMTVLFYGRLSQYKGLEDLFAAAELVLERLPQARFIVAGQPVPGYQVPSPPNLPQGALELRQGYVSNQDLAALMRRASLVVCPYTEATQSAVVLTAYAFGKPVVATNVGGLPEYVRDGETGILVPPSQPQALADGIVRGLAEVDREQLRQGVRRMVEGELSWDSIARQTVAAYRRTIGVAG